MRNQAEASLQATRLCFQNNLIIIFNMPTENYFRRHIFFATSRNKIVPNNPPLAGLLPLRRKLFFSQSMRSGHNQILALRRILSLFFRRRAGLPPAVFSTFFCFNGQSGGLSLHWCNFCFVNQHFCNHHVIHTDNIAYRRARACSRRKNHPYAQAKFFQYRDGCPRPSVNYLLRKSLASLTLKSLRYSVSFS